MPQPESSSETAAVLSEGVGGRSRPPLSGSFGGLPPKQGMLGLVKVESDLKTGVYTVGSRLEEAGSALTFGAEVSRSPGHSQTFNHRATGATGFAITSIHPGHPTIATVDAFHTAKTIKRRAFRLNADL